MSTCFLIAALPAHAFQKCGPYMDHNCIDDPPGEQSGIDCAAYLQKVRKIRDSGDIIDVRRDQTYQACKDMEQQQQQKKDPYSMDWSAVDEIEKWHPDWTIPGADKSRQ